MAPETRHDSLPEINWGELLLTIKVPAQTHLGDQERQVPASLAYTSINADSPQVAELRKNFPNSQFNGQTGTLELPEADQYFVSPQTDQNGQLCLTINEGQTTCPHPKPINNCPAAFVHDPAAQTVWIIYPQAAGCPPQQLTDYLTSCFSNRRLILPDKRTDISGGTQIFQALQVPAPDKPQSDLVDLASGINTNVTSVTQHLAATGTNPTAATPEIFEVSIEGTPASTSKPVPAPPQTPRQPGKRTVEFMPAITNSGLKQPAAPGPKGPSTLKEMPATTGSPEHKPERPQRKAQKRTMVELPASTTPNARDRRRHAIIMRKVAPIDSRLGIILHTLEQFSAEQLQLPDPTPTQQKVLKWPVVRQLNAIGVLRGLAWIGRTTTNLFKNPKS